MSSKIKFGIVDELYNNTLSLYQDGSTNQNCHKLIFSILHNCNNCFWITILQSPAKNIKVNFEIANKESSVSQRSSVQAIVWQPNTTYYNSGKLGQNQILLKIRHEVRDNIGFDQWQGEYIYPGISEDSIQLEGQAKGNIIEFSEIYYEGQQKIVFNNKIQIDTIDKKAIWSDGIVKFETTLKPESADYVEPRLLEKYKKFQTQFFDLECNLSGKLQASQCLIIDKSNQQKSMLSSFGFPTIQTGESSTDIIFDHKAYGLCLLLKYSIDNKTLESKLIDTQKTC